MAEVGFLRRALCYALLSCTVFFTSCFPQTQDSAPVVPSESTVRSPDFALGLTPWAAHVVPFFEFAGGKKGSIAGPGGGGLIADSNGNFYGASQSGGLTTCGYSLGQSDCGLIYKLVPSGSGYVERVLHVFTPSGPGGNRPDGSLLELDGSFYGTAYFGGDYRCSGFGCGTAFKLTPTGSGYEYKVIHSFTGIKGGDGANPRSDLTADAHGNLYGTTDDGGGSFNVCRGGCGTVFELTPSGSGYKETILYRFQGTTDGSVPYSGVIIQHGALIGVTKFSHSTQMARCIITPCGSVYKLVPAKYGVYRYVLVHKFKSGRYDGSEPHALIAGPNGVLYGTTLFGGGGDCTTVGVQSAEGCGVVYSLTPSKGRYVEHIIHRFIKHSDGILPGWRLTLYNGVLFGTTVGGGFVNASRVACVFNDGCGELFSVDPDGTHFRVLYGFKGKDDGAYPFPMLLAFKGSIYGGTLAAGKYGFGTAFRYTP